jgi:hypothetical protein
MNTFQPFEVIFTRSPGTQERIVVRSHLTYELTVAMVRTQRGEIVRLAPVNDRVRKG